ncbi:hypothetical protein CEXT_226011 [Caerostris extrusa]|uniref:Uncharacterized protein n=1 Tax=Caerostris extrusa TaxID=172846 RepID=A0AAV4XY02_CAEEX|nr:hypothetical protein CEXT_226011 [Caerostris extrusa]
MERKKPYVSHLKAFGSEAFVCTHKTKRGTKSILVGCDSKEKKVTVFCFLMTTLSDDIAHSKHARALMSNTWRHSSPEGAKKNRTYLAGKKIKVCWLNRGGKLPAAPNRLTVQDVQGRDPRHLPGRRFSQGIDFFLPRRVKQVLINA